MFDGTESELPHLKPRYSDGPNWFCVETKPGLTDIAINQVLRLGFKTISPTFIARRVNPRTHLVESKAKPLFPGYCFTQFDLDADNWQAINTTYGVKRLMRPSMAEEPLPLPPLVIDDILTKIAAGPLDAVEDLIMFRKGQALRITEGSFQGFQGNCEWSDRSRVKVLLTFFGRPTPIELRPDQVEAMQ